MKITPDDLTHARANVPASIQARFNEFVRRALPAEGSAGGDREVLETVAEGFVATELPWDLFRHSWGELGVITQICLRRAAVNALIARGAEEVGSSDISHELFSRYRRHGGDWNQVVSEYADEA